MILRIEVPDDTIAVSVTALQDGVDGQLNLVTRCYSTEEVKEAAEK